VEATSGNVLTLAADTLGEAGMTATLEKERAPQLSLALTWEQELMPLKLSLLRQCQHPYHDYHSI